MIKKSIKNKKIRFKKTNFKIKYRSSVRDLNKSRSKKTTTIKLLTRAKNSSCKSVFTQKLPLIKKYIHAKIPFVHIRLLPMLSNFEQ